MKDYQKIYNNKLISTKEVANLIKSDSDIIVAQCASEPQGCMEQFHLAKERVENVKVYSVLTLKAYEFYMNPEMKGHFELCSWFHAPGSRKALKEKTGTVTYVPNMLHRAGLDRLFNRRPHLFIGTCTPPDKNGFVSLSLGITYEKDILESADIVVLEVNEELPRTLGDTHIHISDVNYFVENTQAAPSLPSPEPDETAMEIGNHIASLVEDGSTIQLGIGDIPNAAALSLKGKKDLGVHTEMLVDSMMELYEAGVITNKKKSYYKDKFVCTFAMGSPKLYEWLDNNPSVEFIRGKFANDPALIKLNSKMVSINTCIMVDLMGQVASESIGTSQYSGTGGQADTAVGAVEGTDGKGKSIIACRSTAKGGSVSTIVTVLPAGTAVTLHRSNTDYIVTEFGIASLRGKSIKERTEELIKIAHPDFRAQLRSDAEKVGFI
ncbi:MULTISPECIES: acetyl-CoA hydrolase/transferase family protein [unclassified Lentimicrobium]|uniref:acetyl-CoA hydrolase/transferase family protein n=1 Tax=unclassified Lentimicrobium TaxID=2677434 RepID=UPI001555CF06|nr:MULTISPECIES: acetyl-CoA hydrolase/transferase family protein [unclassified Lentimicrobium]NPD44575.1 acetyl-CoA hydrolase/transferase family protein [Lentimicrobium sp. S6]NPD83287.1 acetyl-CoA hydrolase/transferase family protein [Lentimicrobium sp. L6]